MTTRTPVDVEALRGHTPGEWKVESSGGFELTGAEAEQADVEGCEAYALRTLNIVATSKPTGGKRRDPNTGKFDIPVFRTVAEIVFDPRQSGAAEHESNARVIAAASAMCDELIFRRSRDAAVAELVEAIGREIESLRVHADISDDSCYGTLSTAFVHEHLARINSALAAYRGGAPE